MLAACLTAFFGFLRCGEFTTESSSFDPTSNLCLEDVAVNAQVILITIKVSKCDPFRKGCVIQLFRNDTPVCPFQAMTEFLLVRKRFGSEPLSPLFVLPDLQPLSRVIFLKWLNSLCLNAGISGHSFRIGAATAAASAHLPDHLIQMLGRWTSDCYQRYIRTPQTALHQAPTNIAKMIMQSG